MKIKNTEIETMQSALQVLGNRRMATLPADLKVARLLRWLKGPADDYAGVKQKAALAVLDELAVESGDKQPQLTKLQEELLTLRIRDRQNTVGGEEQEMGEIPTGCVLTEADLPKPLPGDDGWKNAAQLGAIVADLGPLYQNGTGEG